MLIFVAKYVSVLFKSLFATLISESETQTSAVVEDLHFFVQQWQISSTSLNPVYDYLSKSEFKNIPATWQVRKWGSAWGPGGPLIHRGRWLITGDQPEYPSP